MEHLIEAIDGTLLALLIVIATLVCVVGCVAFTVSRGISALMEWADEARERNRWL